MGDSPASEFCVNVWEHISIFIRGVSSLAYTIYKDRTVPKRLRIKFRCRGITQKKEYNMDQVSIETSC